MLILNPNTLAFHAKPVFVFGASDVFDNASVPSASSTKLVSAGPPSVLRLKPSRKVTFDCGSNVKS